MNLLCSQLASQAALHLTDTPASDNPADDIALARKMPLRNYLQPTNELIVGLLVQFYRHCAAKIPHCNLCSGTLDQCLICNPPFAVNEDGICGAHNSNCSTAQTCLLCMRRQCTPEPRNRWGHTMVSRPAPISQSMADLGEREACMPARGGHTEGVAWGSQEHERIAAGVCWGWLGSDRALWPGTSGLGVCSALKISRHVGACPGCPPGHELALGGQTCVVGPLVGVTEQLAALAAQSLEISRQTDFLYSYFLAQRECAGTIPHCILCANATACLACGEVRGPPCLPPLPSDLRTFGDVNEAVPASGGVLRASPACAGHNMPHPTWSDVESHRTGEIMPLNGDLEPGTSRSLVNDSAVAGMDWSHELVLDHVNSVSSLLAPRFAAPTLWMTAA